MLQVSVRGKTSEARSNEHFKRGQVTHDEGATHLFAPSLEENYSGCLIRDCPILSGHLIILL